MDKLSDKGKKVARQLMYKLYPLIKRYSQEEFSVEEFERSIWNRVDGLVLKVEKSGERDLEFLELLAAGPLSLKSGFETNSRIEVKMINEILNMLIPKVKDLVSNSKILNPDKLKDLIKLSRRYYQEKYYMKSFLEDSDVYFNKIRENPNANADAIFDLVNFNHPDYELLNVLGSGANKSVFLARSKFLKESRFALKIWDLKYVRKYLKGRSGIDLTERELLEHETRAAEISMQDEQMYINRVRLVSHLRDSTYILVENLFDITLEDAIESNKDIFMPMSVLQLGYQIMNGILTFHRNGLCHGDLKAANVGLKKIKSPNYERDVALMSKDEKDQNEYIRIALTDAGYATTFKLDDRSGTWYFGGASVRAPELYSFNGELVKPTHKSDLWSLGVLMYYATTGEYPFYRTKPNERGDLKEYEQRVYDDISFKLGDPDKRLFDRTEFQDDNPTGLEREIHKEYYLDLENLRNTVSNLLRINPEERNFSWSRS